MPKKIHQLNLKKMYKKYWEIDSPQSICNLIGNTTYNAQFSQLPTPYEVLVDGNDVFLIDTTESQSPYPNENLSYTNQSNSVIIVESTNFIGARPRPR